MTDPAGSGRRRRLWFALALTLVAVVRLTALDADPPATMPDPNVMDEGLWADSARGKVRFDDWFADDLGNARLIAPLYSWLLAFVYALCGIGLWQTRLLAALSSIAIAALAGRYVAARTTAARGLVAVALIGLCPLLDQHGRFALLESPLAALLLLAFSLLCPCAPSAGKAAAGGAALAAAVLVKPLAVTFGGVPIAVAMAIGWRAAVQRGDPDAHRRAARDALAAALGGSAVIAGLGLPVWLPHWREFVQTVAYESGSANWTLGEHLLRWGLIAAREGPDGRQFLATLPRHAALVTAGSWLLLVRRARGGLLAPAPWQQQVLAFALIDVTFAETSYDHAARRAVLFTPALAMLVAGGLRSPRAFAVDARPWRGFAAWLLLLAPAVVLAKPGFVALLAPVVAPLLPPSLTAPDGACDGAAASLLAGWLCLALLPVLAAVAATRWTAAPWLRRADHVGPLLLAALALGELLRLGALGPHADTVRSAQRQFAAFGTRGDIVVGDHAATLFQTTELRTVRRVLPGVRYSTPRPNPDVVDRLRPRFVLDYVAPELREFADVTAHGFRPISRASLLRQPDGTPCYDLQLWERN